MLVAIGTPRLIYGIDDTVQQSCITYITIFLLLTPLQAPDVKAMVQLDGTAATVCDYD